MYIDKEKRLCLTRYIPSMKNPIWGESFEYCIPKWERIEESQLSENQKEKINELKEKGYRITVVVKSLLSNKIYVEYWNNSFQDFEIL